MGPIERTDRRLYLRTVCMQVVRKLSWTERSSIGVGKRLGFERARVWGRMSAYGRRSPTEGAPIAKSVSSSMDANLLSNHSEGYPERNAKTIKNAHELYFH